MSKLNSTRSVKKAGSGLSAEELSEIKQAFNFFDTKAMGRIDPKELKAAMLSLGFDKKNPTIFELLSVLDTPEVSRAGGIDFDSFAEAYTNKLEEKDSKESLQKVFNLFIDENTTTITLNSVRKIVGDIGENATSEELQSLLSKASINGNELTFDEFYDIMTKKGFP